MPLLILFIVVLIVVIIHYSVRPRVTINIIQQGSPVSTDNKKNDVFEGEFEDNVQTYYDGPIPTKIQEEANLQRIFKIIEQHPNGVLATKNPEYVEEYLKRIDLDLPSNITTKDE